MQFYPDYNNMGWAPVDVEVYVNGTDTYYCMALTWTRSSLSDPKFKIMKKTIDGSGAMIRTRHASTTDISWKVLGFQKYELPATDLATVAWYTYL